MFHSKEVKQQLEQASQIKAQSLVYEKTLDEVEQQVAEARVEIDQLGMSASKMDRGLTRVVDCARDTKETLDAAENSFAGIVDRMQDVNCQAQRNAQQYLDRQTFLQKQQDELIKLQEQSKHYTGLSKAISELSSEQNRGITEVDALFEGMQSFLWTMSNLALRSAIEAGRMGDAGKDYIKTAEDIRILSGEFADKMEETRKEVGKIRESCQEMNKQMHQFISLLKDNNVSLARIATGTEEENQKSTEDAKHLEEALAEEAEQLETLQTVMGQGRNRQEQILQEMESIGACYMEQQDSTKNIENIIQNMKGMLLNKDDSKENLQGV